MTTFNKIKTAITYLIVLYTVYLFSYKCVQLKESPLQHAVGSLAHPLAHTHNQACESLSRAEAFVTPYVKQVTVFLDTHVHSHPLFIQYKIEDKLQFVRGQYYKFVYPLILQLFKYIEIAELQAVTYGQALYGKVKTLTK